MTFEHMSVAYKRWQVGYSCHNTQAAEPIVEYCISTYFHGNYISRLLIILVGKDIFMEENFVYC